MWEITELIQLCTTLTQLYLLIYLVSSTISRNKVAIIEKKNCALLLIEKNIMNKFWIKYQLFVSINDPLLIAWIMWSNTQLSFTLTRNTQLSFTLTRNTWIFLVSQIPFHNIGEYVILGTLAHQVVVTLLLNDIQISWMMKLF